jgi:hypothetical protein
MGGVAAKAADAADDGIHPPLNLQGARPSGLGQGVVYPAIPVAIVTSPPDPSFSAHASQIDRYMAEQRGLLRLPERLVMKERQRKSY